MFFPFQDYIRVSIPKTEITETALYTTTYDCMIMFVPKDGLIYPRDSGVGVYVENLFNQEPIQSGGVAPVSPYLFFCSRNETGPIPGTTSGTQTRNGSTSGGVNQYLNTAMILPPGKTLKSFNDGGTDLAGTLHIFRLPFPASI